MQVRRTHAMAEQLMRLYAVATDDETAVLDRLALRAGIKWHCVCGWHNLERVSYCEDCEAPRHDTAGTRPPRSGAVE